MSLALGHSRLPSSTTTITPSSFSSPSSDFRFDSVLDASGNSAQACMVAVGRYLHYKAQTLRARWSCSILSARETLFEQSHHVRSPDTADAVSSCSTKCPEDSRFLHVYMGSFNCGPHPSSIKYVLSAHERADILQSSVSVKVLFIFC